MPAHQEVAVAAEADDRPLRPQQLRGDRGRDAVAHRAGARGELRPVTVELVEAVRPHRVVAGPAREHGVVRESLAQVRHHLGQLELARQLPVAEVGEVVGARLLDPGGAMCAVDRRERRRELRRARDDRQLRLVDAAELVRVGVDVDQPLARARRLEQRVLACGDLAEACAEREDHVGVLDALRKRGVHPDRQQPGVHRRAVVDVVLAAKRGGNGHVRSLGERHDVASGLLAPPAPAHDDQRPLGRREQLERTPDLVGRRRWAIGPVALRVRRRRPRRPGRPRAARRPPARDGPR